MIRLDGLDLKLIYLLMENSRLSISELAERLGVSRPTVKSRLERLEKEGVIKRYTIKLNPELQRAKNIVILIIETEKPNKLHEFEEIIEINRFASRKYLVKVAVEDMKDLKNIIEKPEFEVLEIMPILESIEKEYVPKVKVSFKCDYCGKEIVGEPIIYKYRNKVYFFCCETCLREFKRARKNLEKSKKEQEINHTHYHQNNSHS
ncbi:transcriptional regulatory protein [Pyrococcus sp. NA2]|uniref:TRASH domain-containing protein n=1 Tax=Pyrococcus sp. (strain NA2) TaxID=342949 RepID=UPI000209A941|nr:TRASH domain-containing protein [Pyrococcus sp. NA2]AEC52491.1 transcriptional regulatory protein [Pyrococcus sp. NA2]